MACCPAYELLGSTDMHSGLTVSVKVTASARVSTAESEPLYTDDYVFFSEFHLCSTGESKIHFGTRGGDSGTLVFLEENGRYLNELIGIIAH